MDVASSLDNTFIAPQPDALYPVVQTFCMKLALGDAQGLYSELGQFLIAQTVAFGVVDRPINLNTQSRGGTIEVENKTALWMLTPEPAARLVVSQNFPMKLFLTG